jgi:hypothetical protein
MCSMWHIQLILSSMYIPRILVFVTVVICLFSFSSPWRWKEMSTFPSKTQVIFRSLYGCQSHNVYCNPTHTELCLNSEPSWPPWWASFSKGNFQEEQLQRLALDPIIMLAPTVIILLVPYDAVDRNKVSIRQLVFIFLFSHYMFRPLWAIFRWGIQCTISNTTDPLHVRDLM